MLTEREKDELKKAIPTTFNVVYKKQTYNIPVSIRYGNQYKVEFQEKNYPAVVLQYETRSDEDFTPLNHKRSISKEYEEDLIYLTGTNVYDLVAETAEELVDLYYYEGGVEKRYTPAAKSVIFACEVEDASDLNGWTKIGSGLQAVGVSTDAHVGSKSLKVTYDHIGTFGAVYRTVSVSLTNTSWSMWVKNTNSFTNFSKITFQLNDGSNTLTYDITSLPSNSGWNQLVVDLNNPTTGDASTFDFTSSLVTISIFKQIGATGVEDILFDYMQNGGFAVTINDNNQVVFNTITPDDNSYFTVIYDIDRAHLIIGGAYNDRLTIEVIAKDRNTGTEDIPNWIPGIVVASQITEQLRQWFKYIFEHRRMVCRDVTSIRNLDLLTNIEGRFRRQFDARIHHNVLLKYVDYDIKEMDYTIDLQNP